MIGVPEQVPFWHESAWVQRLPSSQGVPLPALGFEHTPVLVLQVPATWHWSEAVQMTGLLPIQKPAWQVSVCVQALPSPQGAVFGVLTQPVAGSQLSSVHPLRSSQFGGGPPTHSPSLQVSSVVQASPSSQGFVFGTWRQPSCGSQLSSVQP